MRHHTRSGAFLTKKRFKPGQPHTIMPRYRDKAVDMMKFLAVFLIINSHADAMYPHLSQLATGGAIGDCVFLFVSGYTLFLTARRRFADYFKRRIARIYPSVIASLLFILLINPSRTVGLQEFVGGEFIMALMVYYIIIYAISLLPPRTIPISLASTFTVSVIIYLLFFPTKHELGAAGIYGITTCFRWIPFFAFMLGGAWTGVLVSSGTLKPAQNCWRNFFFMALNVLLFYGIQIAGKINPAYAPLQILTLIPLAGTIWFMYRWCSCGAITRLFDLYPWGKVILWVSGLCLESYLIQFALFTPALNSIWPLNLIIITALILAAAWLVKHLARFISSAFAEAKG